MIRAVTEYELEFEDRFEGPALDERRWLRAYLPQWSSRERAAARYRFGDGGLELLIEEDQQPWCPEWDGELRVSSLQTGVFGGPVGSHLGQQSAVPRRRRRPRGAARAAALHAPLRPHRDPPARARSPAGDGRAVDDRVRGRAGALGRDLHRRDLRPRRPRPRPRQGRDGHPQVRRPRAGRGVGAGGAADRRPRAARLRRRVDARARRVLGRRRARQDRRAVARLPDAADARDLRVPGRGGRASTRTSSTSTTCAGTGARDARRAEPATGRTACSPRSSAASAPAPRVRRLRRPARARGQLRSRSPTSWAGRGSSWRRTQADAGALACEVPRQRPRAHATRARDGRERSTSCSPPAACRASRTWSRSTSTGNDLCDLAGAHARAPAGARHRVQRAPRSRAAARPALRRPITSGSGTDWFGASLGSDRGRRRRARLPRWCTRSSRASTPSSCATTSAHLLRRCRAGAAPGAELRREAARGHPPHPGGGHYVELGLAAGAQHEVHPAALPPGRRREDRVVVRGSHLAAVAEQSRACRSNAR